MKRETQHDKQKIQITVQHPLTDETLQNSTEIVVSKVMVVGGRSLSGTLEKTLCVVVVFGGCLVVERVFLVLVGALIVGILEIAGRADDDDILRFAGTAVAESTGGGTFLVVGATGGGGKAGGGMKGCAADVGTKVVSVAVSTVMTTVSVMVTKSVMIKVSVTVTVGASHTGAARAKGRAPRNSDSFMLG